MPAPHRDFAAETAAQRQADALHQIAVAAELLRIAIGRLPPSRAASIALTNLDTAERWAERAARGDYVAPPAGGGL